MSVAKYVRTQWKIGMFEPPNSSDGTVYLHREIASEKLGRKLKPGETVHHVDEDKFNNDPENLWVFRSNADHSSYHNQKLLNLIPEIIINKMVVIPPLNIDKRYYVSVEMINLMMQINVNLVTRNG